jgi:Transposase domain (DUF772)/Transposase DDE domain
MLKTDETLSCYWLKIQECLFPFVEKEIGQITEKHKKLIGILEFIRIEKFISCPLDKVGCPLKDRRAITRAFIAKALFQLQTTRATIDRIKSDTQLKRICGWESDEQIPSESTFSRAFSFLSTTEVLNIIHQATVNKYLENSVVLTVSRDSTKIEAREKPQYLKEQDDTPSIPKKRGRPKKGQEKVKELKTIEKQMTQSLDQILNDLPKVCNKCTKKDSKGYKNSWNGYKFHCDVTEDQVPISCLLTSASIHDSQVSIPLSIMSSQKAAYLVEIADAAYDSKLLNSFTESLGLVPITDKNPRRKKKIEFTCSESIIYNQRTVTERIFGRLKDEFGARYITVKGYHKVMTHLMFGVLCLTVDQIIRLIC